MKNDLEKKKSVENYLRKILKKDNLSKGINNNIIKEIGLLTFSKYLFIIIIEKIYNRIINIELIGKLIYLIYLLRNKHREPFIKPNILMKFYKFRTAFYPCKKYHNFKKNFSIEEDSDFKYAVIKNDRIAFPKHWNKIEIRNNFNSILNEFSHDKGNTSPHQYISLDKIERDWIVYDIGTAEGYQAKIWSQKVKYVVIFEPDYDFYSTLLKTFENEIKCNKVKILNIGVSNKKKEIRFRNQTYKFDSLDNIILEFNLPKPNYLKVDIEGEEMNFLKGSKTTLESKCVDLIEITTYHRPNDYIEIPNYLNNYRGNGHFTDGVMLFNRNGVIIPKMGDFYSPIIRKCLYKYKFDSK